MRAAVIDVQTLKFDEKGLIPAIVQDVETGKVLTLAYMNRQSLAISLEKGLTCFVPFPAGAVAQGGNQRQLPAHCGAAGRL
ncbi:MAG: hypothetical protein ACLURW_13720 [Flavonifractor plautii]